MTGNQRARKGSFSVVINQCGCPAPASVVYTREVPTTFPDKNRVVDEVIACVSQRFVPDAQDLFRIRLCVDEGIQNAFSHGNRSDPGKRLRVTVYEEEDRWGVIIGDEGDGFGIDAVSDPRTPAGRWREHGRGLLIMSEYMDDVSFFDCGRTLRLVKLKVTQRSYTQA